MTDVAVLLLAFNRPQRLAQLIDNLRKVQPRAVYVAVDGPRSAVAGEREAVSATRDEVGRIDWTCDVHTLYRESNLGCGRAVSGAIDWLFSREERGIILEDDVLPDPSFFPFCLELLDRYENDARVWSISGCNFAPPDHISTDASYRFATVPNIWGWATWRRSWSRYEYDARRWRRRLDTSTLWRASGRDVLGFAYWTAMFDQVARGAIDTWACQTVLTAFAAGGLTATSNTNLIENVGFGAASTHTATKPTFLLPAGAVDFPLVHPLDVVADSPSDHWHRRQVLMATPAGLSGHSARFVRNRLFRS